jgi:hydrogenase-4 component F
MKELLLILCPLLGAAIAFAWPSNRTRPWLLPAVGVVQTVLALWLLVSPPEEAIFAWVRFDSLARAVLPMVALLFLACSAYGVAYLRLREERGNRVFVAALLALLGLISLAHQAQHLGLLWVAVETATLTTVPLLHFNGTARAFEATWKYLLVGGTGIALSLLGSFCLGYASLHGGSNGDLTFAALAAQGGQLSRHWVLTAWVLLLVGYGTKMGLAPMHTWKPDAYGEAPGIVGALLAGGMTTTAFIALLRVRQVVDAAGAGDIAGQTMLALGLFSMVVAALFLLGTPDFKRMLAYSSVEHMGILSVGAAMGGAGVAAALFHVWTNGLTKGALFLSAGNLRRAAGGRSRDEVAGMALRSPVSARIFVAGLLAVTACPPFGPFFSELRVVRTAFETSHGMAAAGFLSCMLFAFFGMSRLVFAIVDGRPRKAARASGDRFRETAGVLVPPLVLLGCSLWLGLATPKVLSEAWKGAAAELCPKVAKGEGAEIRNPKSEVRRKSETRNPKSENGGAVSVGGAPASGPASSSDAIALLGPTVGVSVRAGPEAGAPGRQLRSQLARSGFEFRFSALGFRSDVGFWISDFPSP